MQLQVVRCLAGQALAQQDCSESLSAELLLRCALQRCEEEAGVGLWHPDAISIAQNLAEVLLLQYVKPSQSRTHMVSPKEVEALFRRAVKRQRTQNEVHGCQGLRCIQGLCHVLLLRAQVEDGKQMQRLKEAEPMFQGVAQGLEDGLGSGHPDALANFASLALCLQLQGRTQEAEDAYSYALPGLRYFADKSLKLKQQSVRSFELLGASVQGARSAARNFAALLKDEGDSNSCREAEALFRWSEAATKKVCS
eukprot:TRINITY_DN17254_c0_g1_i3.p1 TRINITY_DN17254_c0_g1~~TRINITY_DN17254_c0_g1_i3.p1  ORF type:complete len:252 (-),score=59.04 TRINITY_DN17254_c0_g1_i3:563-1318(-)